MRLPFTGFLLLSLVSWTHSYLISGGLHTETTNQFGEQTGNCENNTRRCLGSEGQCQNDQCVCKHNKVGDGVLGCVAANTYRCLLRNDPSATTFNDEFFGVPSPCRTYMFKYRYYYPAMNNATTATDGKICLVRGYSYGERVLGKLFSGGFDLNIWVRRPEHGQSEEVDLLHFRGFGVVEQEGSGFKYKFQTLINTDSGWENANANPQPDVGVGYSVTIDDNNNNRIVFESEECQLYIAWRPPHPEQGGTQIKVPGMFISVKSDGPGELEWPDDDSTICSSPGGPLMETSRANLNLNTKDEAAVKITFLSQFQWPNFIASSCKPTAQAIETCTAQHETRSEEAFKQCLFLIHHPHAIACQSSEDTDSLGNTIMTNFRNCVNAICTGSRSDCNAFRNDVISAPCIDADFENWTMTETVCNALPNP